VAVVHEVPSDLIEHDTTSLDCVCGPTVMPVLPVDEEHSQWVIHHPLVIRKTPI
jgi:hypothetical protein